MFRPQMFRKRCRIFHFSQGRHFTSFYERSFAPNERIAEQKTTRQYSKFQMDFGVFGVMGGAIFD